MANQLQCYLLKLKNKNCQYIYKKTDPLFYFPDGQMRQSQSAMFFLNFYVKNAMFSSNDI